MKDGHKHPSVLLFGCPGSGKGTQGAVLGRLPNLIHLAMGDIFRSLDKTSPLGTEFLSYSTRGLLVPDELTVRVFKAHVQEKATRGELVPAYHWLILDGVPRTTAQVSLLSDVVEVMRIVYLFMDDVEGLVARLSARAASSGRPDDADPSVIRRRIEVYERETAPVLEAYPQRFITRVNADQPPLAVLRDVAAALVGVVSPKI